MGPTRKRQETQLTRECFILVAIIILGASLTLASSSADIKVNILFFYEHPDTVKSFDLAVDYVKNNPALGYSIGEVSKSQSNGTDATRLIMNLCRDIDTAYGKPADQQPDIVIDFTRSGLSSEAVKLVTKVMTLPTISGSFGQEGDIRNWRNLTKNAKNYLIQISPPADMVPQAVRSIVSHQNMTNAAFLYDSEYEMYHKNNTLLKGMPIKKQHFAKLETSITHMRRQLDFIVHKDYANFFIGGSPTEISQVMAQASDLDIKDGPYFNDEYAWYSMSMEPEFPKCNDCQCNNVSIVHLMPLLSLENNERWTFLQSKGMGQRLMEMFYFDLAMNSMSAVAKMKKDKTWVSPPKRVCRQAEQAPDDSYQLPLFDALKGPSISDKNLLGPFHLDPEREVGKSHANFQMSINRLVFKKKEGKPESMKQIGVWTTGFGEKELITGSDKEEAEWKAHLAVTRN